MSIELKARIVNTVAIIVNARSATEEKQRRLSNNAPFLVAGTATSAGAD
jgi:hypothetical protein